MNIGERLGNESPSYYSRQDPGTQNSLNCLTARIDNASTDEQTTVDRIDASESIRELGQLSTNKQDHHLPNCQSQLSKKNKARKQRRKENKALKRKIAEQDATDRAIAEALGTEVKEESYIEIGERMHESSSENADFYDEGTGQDLYEDRDEWDELLDDYYEGIGQDMHEKTDSDENDEVERETLDTVAFEDWPEPMKLAFKGLIDTNVLLRENLRLIEDELKTTKEKHPRNKPNNKSRRKNKTLY